MDALRSRLQAALGQDFQIERELPGGGMSRLFVATDRGLGRAVVVKVLPPELTSEVSAARFQREISVTAQLQHPHILPVLSAGARQGLLYYLTPYVEGDTLRDRLRRGGQLPVSEVIRILDEITEAVAYAHAHGVVHRDIKPGNILLPGEHAVLADFGIARAIDAGRTTGSGGSNLTATGSSLGTPGYMAPEQIAGEAHIDARADVYALAVIGYEMLTGSPPFGGGSARAILAAQMAEHPTPLPATRGDVPSAVTQAIMRGLSSDPAHRPASAGEFRRALTVASLGGAATRRFAPSAGRRRLLMGTLVGSGAAAIAGIVWFAMYRRPPSLPAATASTVAVMPFTVTAPPGHAYLGAGMVDLLSTTLDGAGDLRAADPRTVVAASRKISGPLDVDAARTIAERVGAALFVLGSVFNVGSQLRVSAELYDVSARRRLGSATADGDTSDVFGIVDRVSAQLLAARGSGPGARITHVASVTTQSLPALKAYLEGEAAFRSNKFEAAADAYQRAVAADSTFALAYYSLSIADEWLARNVHSESAARGAVRFSTRLAPHERMLLEGLLATRRGAVLEAERIYRSDLGIYPDDVEAWWQLGEIAFHNGPTFGLPIANAYGPFTHVLALDPTSTPAYLHLARVAAAVGTRAAVDSFTGRAIALSPAGDRAFEMRSLRAAVNDDSADLRRITLELTHVDDAQIFFPGWSVAVFAHRPDLARPLQAGMANPSRSSDTRARGYCLLAAMDLARGRVRDAGVDLDRAQPLAPATALEYRGLITLLPFRSLLADTARALQTQLSGWRDAMQTPDADVSVGFISANNGIHALIRAYLLGLVAADRADAAAAQHEISELPKLAGAGTHAQLARDFQAAIRGELAWHERPASAVAPLSYTNEAYYPWFVGSPFWSQARQRYRHAQALVAAGQDTAAARWFSSFEVTTPDDLMYLAPSELERGRIYERLGQPAQAAAHYRAFLKWWSDPDPEFQPLVQEAKRRLAALPPS